MSWKKILSIIVCCMAVNEQLAVAQSPSSGFFMIMPVSKNCGHRILTLRGDKSYCVAPEPIIPIQQFQSVKSAGTADKWYVDVRFTPEGLAIKQRIADALPESTFLLVVDGKAVALFATDGKCLSSITYDDLKWAVRHLEKQIKKRP